MKLASQTTQKPSRENHYVPIWYQRGFSVAGADTWLLDISPGRQRPDGTPILAAPRQRSPKSGFWEKDLYVTRFGELFNDQVETVLFQDIDDFGAAAVRAFIGGDVNAVHDQYRATLAYLGAQKLRTPKGLDWIRSRYPALSQVELMVEMQHLREMFGTLWAESAHEIVSAEDSEVKFLVTDHPVTTFNVALPESAALMAYPNDAPISWNGTHTLFALDANHLLILTHVPYAKNPEGVALTTKRVNARYFGHTLLHTDRLIRTRRFDTQAVIAVNAWLKSRAHRYIAAGRREWLYPERDGPIDLSRLALLLRPNQGDLWRVGGEVYIGYKDGTSGYFDAYGRTSREHEVVAKPPQATPPTADALCPCGGGAPYGACCEALPPWERPPWDVLSLRERNLRFLNAITNVLDLFEPDSWQRVQRTLSDDQVAQLHRLSSMLWPESTDLAALLPHPGDGRLRAIYMGPSDPRTVGESIISLVPLFDQILVMDPVLPSRNVRPEYSPVTSPAQHKQQLLKNVRFWLLLEPLIVAGKVLVFRDPCELSTEFRRAMWTMAKERTADWQADPEAFDDFRWLLEDDTHRMVRRLPDRMLASMLRRSSPELSDAEVDEAIASMRRKAEGDPLALLQVPGDGEKLEQFQGFRGVNLEIALFVAQSAGATIVTDVRALWDHLHRHTRAATDDLRMHLAHGMSYATAIDQIDVQKLAASDAAAAAKASLLRLQSAAELGSSGEELKDEVEAVRQHLLAIDLHDVVLRSPELQVQMDLTLSIPRSGFESPTVQRLVVGFGREMAPIKTGLAILRRTRIGEVATDDKAT